MGEPIPTPNPYEEKVARNEKTIIKLPCFGCAHAAASAPYPGSPSGERPCGICIRNHVEKRSSFIASNNDVQIYGPKDMYWSLDRMQLELADLHTHHPWLSADPEKVRYAKKKKSPT